jgi:lipid A 3-O-deacylase
MVFYVYRLMLYRKILFVALFCAIPLLDFAQAVDNNASFRMIPATRYMRLHYENDFFTGTDLYYTQGINLEIVAPSLRKFFLNKILIVPKSGNSQFGVSLEHNGYTPSSITHDEILVGDRPFAAALFLKNFSMTSDSVRRLRITSSLSTGVIGSAASGYRMQKGIHKWLNGTPPHGWENQIRNDLVLNYEAGLEKNLFSSGRYFVINGFANGRAGTLSDKLSAGFVVMAGKLNSAITSVFCRNQKNPSQKFSIHLYAQPVVNIVAYDATMQGGVFNRTSPYTISFSEMRHVTVEANYGLVIQYHSINVEYFKSAISKEFDTGSNHRWGGVRVGVSF